MRRQINRAVALGLMTASLTLAGSAQADALHDRGKYLMEGIVACGNCHTPKGPDGKALADRELAGGDAIDAPIFHAMPPNITPDPETGIGKWSDAQIINAIRNGKRPDGTLIGPPMPIAFYRDMSDNDVRAIVAYLRQVKPVRNQVAKSTYRIPLPPSYGPEVTKVAEIDPKDALVYGRYMATALGHCMDCHTPLVEGRNDLSRIGAGGNQFGLPGGGVVTSPNLTPANKDGIAKWTDAQLTTAIQTGATPDRAMVRLMAFDWYAHVNTQDMAALVAFLRSLKPAQ